MRLEIDIPDDDLRAMAVWTPFKADTTLNRVIAQLIPIAKDWVADTELWEQRAARHAETLAAIRDLKAALEDAEGGREPFGYRPPTYATAADGAALRDPVPSPARPATSNDDPLTFSLLPGQTYMLGQTVDGRWMFSNWPWPTLDPAPPLTEAEKDALRAEWVLKQGDPPTVIANDDLDDAMGLVNDLRTENERLRTELVASRWTALKAERLELNLRHLQAAIRIHRASTDDHSHTPVNRELWAVLEEIPDA